MKEGAISFSFGKNWKEYLGTVSEREIDRAKQDIVEWLGADSVAGRRVLDIGSGSGIHSLALHQLGAREVRSFDYDEHSVAATRILWQGAGQPDNWFVSHGSILDAEYVKSLGQFDLVYSWGVLHHTGSMWEAIGNATSLVRPRGRLWISLYAKGPRYPKDLKLKKKYNAAGNLGKRWMVFKRIARLMLLRLKHRKNPFAWNEKRVRGMNVYHDIIDWLGGLPYEVAGPDEVLRFGRQRGLILERIQVRGEGACDSYLFSFPQQPVA